MWYGHKSSDDSFLLFFHIVTYVPCCAGLFLKLFKRRGVEGGGGVGWGGGITSLNFAC